VSKLEKFTKAKLIKRLRWERRNGRSWHNEYNSLSESHEGICDALKANIQALQKAYRGAQAELREKGDKQLLWLYRSTTQIEALKKELSEAVGRIPPMRERIAELIDAANAKEQKITEMFASLKKLMEENCALQAQLKAKDNSAAVNALIASYATKNGELRKELENRFAELNETRKTLEGMRQSLNDVVLEREAFKTEAERLLKERHKSSDDRAEPLLHRITQLSSQVEEFRAAYADVQKKWAEKRDQADMFASDNIKLRCINDLQREDVAVLKGKVRELEETVKGRGMAIDSLRDHLKRAEDEACSLRNALYDEKVTNRDGLRNENAVLKDKVYKLEVALKEENRHVEDLRNRLNGMAKLYDTTYTTAESAKALVEEYRQRNCDNERRWGHIKDGYRRWKCSSNFSGEATDRLRELLCLIGEEEAKDGKAT
jgi:chromosome segregation ATPase